MGRKHGAQREAFIARDGLTHLSSDRPYTQETNGAHIEATRDRVDSRSAVLSGAWLHLPPLPSLAS